MSGCNQHSGKYWSIQDGVISSNAQISRLDSPPSLSNTEINKSGRNSLTTPQLISAIRHLWGSAFRPKENVYRDDDDKGFSKRNGLLISNTTDYYCVNPGATTCFGSLILQEKLDFPKVTHKILILKSSYGNRDYVRSLFQRVLQTHDKNSNEYCVTEPENLETNSLVARDCVTIDTGTASLANQNYVCNPDVLIPEASSLSNDAVNSLCSDYFLQTVPDNQMEVGVCQTLSSSIYADYRINSSLATSNTASVQCRYKIDDNQLKGIRTRHLSDVSDNERKVQIFSANHKQASHSLAKQEHAFSGAMAGICVSCCLHPVDTIKTVLQSCRAEQRSIFYIAKSIVSDRGFPGLYRGITTNIACSAPISAVYTFTYESVKAALLPYLPKEYYSSAHCVGGGCASIATSFIFTPSERIKQQMQIGSHYRNCWDALIGIIKNGGLSSLYAGWKAVLCRNIPHSMIKVSSCFQYSMHVPIEVTLHQSDFCHKSTRGRLA
ncbi:unnamed protein product [Vicia faba]|uniref:Mitochondrial carrier protein n=1 Tax=Vicia faba TaxID=3906 RepID=A0AAV1BA70_VICFA|nr:unnamed protein product [Vicia faba]